MTNLELLKLHEGFLNVMLANKININDVRYIPIVEEYWQMRRRKEKTTYIICHLSSKYHLTERGVYKIISRFNKPVVIQKG